MELVEKSNDSAILSAKVRAVCWSNIWSMLSAYFLHETGCTLSAGMKVLVEVRVEFHAVYGLSLQITGIDPTYTIGDLAGQKRKVIERLEKEGMTKMQQLLSLPVLPERLAIISSPDAAGYDDFTHQIKNSGYKLKTTLYPAVMQGDKAVDSVINALDKIYAQTDGFDAVVIIRGGGATTDLSCFDDYELALHIAQFPIPIITGIGHQRDVSVADLVAYRSVKTPTAAAEFFIEFYHVQQELLSLLKNRLLASAEKRVTMQAGKMEMLKLKLLKITESYLQAEHSKILMIDRTMNLLSPETIYNKGYSLTRLNGQIIKSVKMLNEGDIICTEWTDGMIKSKVVTE